MNLIDPSISEQIILTIFISVLIIIGLSLFTGFMNGILPVPGTDSGVIENWKNDARKFRLIPKILLFCLFYTIEYSYNFGIFLGKCLKFIFIKETK